jgi:hypothetical protein
MRGEWMMCLWQQRDIHLLKSFMGHYCSPHEHKLHAINEMLYVWIKKPQESCWKCSALEWTIVVISNHHMILFINYFRSHNHTNKLQVWGTSDIVGDGNCMILPMPTNDAYFYLPWHQTMAPLGSFIVNVLHLLIGIT